MSDEQVFFTLMGLGFAVWLIGEENSLRALRIALRVIENWE